jgi:hypothetical protein
MDLMGPFKDRTRDGFRYVLVILDEFSPFSAVRQLRKKSDAGQAIVSQVCDWESLLGRKVRGIRSDGGGSLFQRSFMKHDINEFKLIDIMLTVFPLALGVSFLL